MVSSFPLPGFCFRVERYEAQRDARVAQPRASSKERDKLMVALRGERRKRVPT
jgi:hypothetical protein